VVNRHPAYVVAIKILGFFKLRIIFNQKNEPFTSYSDTLAFLLFYKSILSDTRHHSKHSNRDFILSIDSGKYDESKIWRESSSFSYQQQS